MARAFEAGVSVGRRVTLGELSERGHANNFNLLRLLAALAVIVSHGFPLTGNGNPPLGEYAVDVFFLTSGFLVTKSLMVHQDLFEFALARVLRIYPGLLVMVALTVLVAGAFSPAGFFADPLTLEYIGSTALLWLPKLSHFRLPGVFASNPYPFVVNGSLHTLPFELRMYAVLAVIWALTALWRRSRQRLMGWAVCALAVIGVFGHLLHPAGVLTHYLFMFFCGGAYYVLRRRIVMNGKWALLLAAVILASALDARLFPVAYSLLLGYVLFAATYLPALWRPKHDYSYGVYIYAFPVQQAIARWFPGVSWWEMSLLAMPPVLCLAAASWHLVEKPSMALKHRLSGMRRGVVVA